MIKHPGSFGPPFSLLLTPPPPHLTPHLQVTCFEQAAPHGGVLVSAAFRDALLGLSGGYACGTSGGGLRSSLARSARRHAAPLPVRPPSPPLLFHPRFDAVVCFQAIIRGDSEINTTSPPHTPQVPASSLTEFEFVEMPAITFRDEARPAFLVRGWEGGATLGRYNREPFNFDTCGLYLPENA